MSIICNFYLSSSVFSDRRSSMKEKKMFATRIDKDILKSLKLIGVHSEKPINALLEEAIQDLLQKYKKPQPKKK